MASHAFTKTNWLIHTQALDLEAANCKLLMVMTNTQFGTDAAKEYEFLGDVTTPDIFDGANYEGGHGEAGRVAVTVTIVEDATGHAVRYKLTPDPVPFGVQVNGTRAIKGYLLIIEGTTDDSDARNVFYFERATGLNPAGDSISFDPDSTDGNYVIPT